MFRTFQELNRSARSELAPALAEVRAKVWSKVDTHRSAPVILDIDASIVEIHSESKEMAEPTYKGGFGFHPMFCFSDLTGEALSSVLRAGNAGANTVADHVTVLDRAIDQLPSRIAKGHRAGDEAALTSRQVIVRADSAGCTTGFLTSCRERNVSFFVAVRANAQLESAIHETSVIDSMWTPSVTQDGTLRDGASVCEVTELVDMRVYKEPTVTARCRNSRPRSYPKSHLSSHGSPAALIVRRQRVGARWDGRAFNYRSREPALWAHEETASRRMP